MPTYHYHKQGFAIPYDHFGHCVLRQKVDIPAMIASGAVNLSPLAVSDVRTALPSTGFAASDILQLWRVPAGFLLRNVGVRVSTAEGATCTADIGNSSTTQTHLLGAAPAGYQGTLNLALATTQICLITDTDLGASTVMGCVFITDGTIDITFGHADTETCIFDVWAVGCKVF